LLEDQVGIKSVVIEIGDLHTYQADVERVHDGNQEIMGEGSGYGYALQSDRDRIRFWDTHPDWQVAFGILLFEDRDAVLVGEADADTIDYALDHFSHDAPDFLFVMIPVL